MKIINIDKVPKVQDKMRLFSGTVMSQMLVSPEMSHDVQMAVVSFAKGARNKLHFHSTDQTLIVTSGEGIVATEKEQHVVHPGDVAFIPAGEKHWHGATKDSEFSHIYVIAAGSKITQIED